jgi:hypothetical protein
MKRWDTGRAKDEPLVGLEPGTGLATSRAATTGCRQQPHDGTVDGREL